MEIYKIENLTFTYPGRISPALSDITLSVNHGEFITLCGKSGCGKTTLLRLLKKALSPHGTILGNILFDGKELSELSHHEQASEIGFVMQSPDNQIVTDKVWHELAFGLESLGYSTTEIRTRVAEMASFFGIQNWFHKKVTELSGGQKQLLNLASVMVMQPSVLILDEPTSQLDPIAAQEFLKTLEKINRELGITVILSEHRLEEAFPVSDRVIVMDNGKIIADSTPCGVGEILKNISHDMYEALPVPMRIYGAVKNDLKCPLTVRDGRVWLEEFSKTHELNPEQIVKREKKETNNDVVIELKDVWFRYEKELPDVVKGLNIRIHKGDFLAIVGGNGTGKTTALSIIGTILKPYRGKVFIKGEKTDKISNAGILGVLPQNPQALFVKKTVFLDLMEILSESKISAEEKKARVESIALLCRIENLLESHPYDLSGGEQQRAALAKVLLKNPEILLLDEPTKGMDAHFKICFADILSDLKACGVTVVMVSHDIEFCAEYADRCAMFFDGSIVSEGSPGEFFSGKNFYTTSANRMARTKLPEAVLTEDIIRACGGEIKKRENTKRIDVKLSENKNVKSENKEPVTKGSIMGLIFAALFVITAVFFSDKFTGWKETVVQIISIIELALCCISFLPQKELGISNIQQPSAKRRLTKRTAVAAILILIVIPLTVFTGVFYLGDRKYYFISLLIILETLIPFCMIFERRKPEARELVIISVLCAISIASRTAFFMLPQFKPVVAMVIISGVCFGGEAGFLVGAVTGFISNFYFGQGPWTPWQMFAFGIISFLGGVLFQKGFLRKTRASLSIFGCFAAFFIYGGIVNPASVIMSQSKLTWDAVFSAYKMGMPFDIVHAVSTAFFLWFISEAMIDKLERVKIKYGLIEE